MTKKEQLYLSMLMKKSPNDIVEFIQNLSPEERQYTIDIMLEYVFEHIEESIEEMKHDYEMYREPLNKQEDLSGTKEYLKKFQLNK